MAKKTLETEQKALEINLDESIYGTFAEIGAGQEVARYFFQAGAAAGTIAKTMSAYDKVYSDKIYGAEESGRYVCESRLYKMLDHEYELMDQRLTDIRPKTRFFAFADTVSAINYQKTIKGSGWLGLRFQLDPHGGYNDVVLHVKMLDNDNGLQQQAIGILGVNLLYACYRYSDNQEVLIESLIDNLRGRVEIDMIRISGPDFVNTDNRLMSLYLVKHKLSDVAMFNSEGKSLHASEMFYKKDILVVRGSFRPATLVNMDMLRKSKAQFGAEESVNPRNIILLTEITLDNLTSHGDLDEKDFLDRAEILCALGQTVIVTNCEEHQKLIAYLSDYRIKKLGIVLGVQVLLTLMNEKYYKNMDGRLLAAFGELFTTNVKLYIYPSMQEGSSDLMTCQNLPIPNEIKFLYKHLLDSQQIVDVQGFDKNTLHIYSAQVLEMLRADEDGWETMVSPKIAALIKEKCLFGFPSERMEFEY